MLATLITLGILLSGVLASIIWPIHFPATMLDAFDTFYGALWRMYGYFPVDTLFTDGLTVLTILIAKKIYNMAVGLIALVSGGGKPEL